MKPCLIVIPAYNEAAHIADVVHAALPHGPVLVIDDGSTDDTVRRALRAGAVVERQWPNQGKGAALQAGFRRAIEWGYDLVVTLDADGQHDPREIATFLEAYRRAPADLIIGQRAFHQMPMVRRAANTLGQVLFSWAIGRPIPDNQSGYRMLRRRLIEALLDHEERGFEFEVAMIAICIREGYRLGWVPIRTIYNGGASHIHPLTHTLNFVRVALTARQMVRQASARVTPQARAIDLTRHAPRLRALTPSRAQK